MAYLYLFILGRNIGLSKAEIHSFLKVHGIKILDFHEKSNAFLAELDKDIAEEEIKSLGGVICAGKVISKISDISDISGIKRVNGISNLYFGNKNNITYVTWNFSNEKNYEIISDFLKKEFKKEKLKATRKNLTGILQLQDGQNGQDGKKISIIGNDVDEQFFIFENYFGKIFFTTDYESIEFRDISKPYRRESLAISPRLAKIMINLSETKNNERIVDAFCGVGVILSEALLKGMKSVGIDMDEEALKMAEQNLRWLKINSENYNLIHDDSSKVKLSGSIFNSLVTEPELGEMLKEVPTSDKASFIIRKYENLMIGVLSNLKNYVKHRFVFTAPYILIQGDSNKRVSCNADKIAKKCGLKVVGVYPEFRKNQAMGREIIIMEH